MSGLGSGGADDNDAQAGRLVVGALTTRCGNTQDDAQTTQLVVAAPLSSGKPGTSNQAGRRQEDDVNLVAFHLTQDPISECGRTPALARGNGDGCASIAVAFQCHGGNVGEMGTLRSGNGGLTGGVPFTAVAFSENQRAEVVETDYAHQLTAGGGKALPGLPAARIGTVVRRLTPVECERLQGFPDGWTEIDGPAEYVQTAGGSWRAKTGTPDSPRYSAMGDAVTVPVIEWIARRIVEVDKEMRS